ncbi:MULTISPECIES: TetR/AcrR family transcriptional regulator [Mycetocola]|uniref:TetR/AcrR family transcriptional regulator n=1 Tax=Mycetocola TaxID=76634 RepID=UPI00165D0562|nr:TetR/AcrR family transcriptional regulator [Mycetocola sp. JXN-3]
MTTPTKRKRVTKPAEERRQDLIDAGVIEFVRSGVTDAKIEDITATAEVSKGTFYLYFKTKDELAAAAWERHMNTFAETGEAILNDPTVPLDVRMVSALQALCRFALDHADVHKALYDGAGAEKAKYDANERLISLIGSAARWGVDTGQIDCPLPEMMARALYHGFCAAATDAITGFVPIDRDEMIEAAGLMARTTFGLDAIRPLPLG